MPPDLVGGQGWVPATLWHGTNPELVDKILTEGLLPVAYLTDRIHVARESAWKRARTHNDHARGDAGVLIIDVAGLTLTWASAFRCPTLIDPARITRYTAPAP